MAIRAIEADAEVLVTHQLDLLAQLEAQLRAVHHTMRSIEKLRGKSYRRRSGREVTNGERIDTMTALASEIAAIEQELRVQHRSCEDMQRCIGHMQVRLEGIRQKSGVKGIGPTTTAEHDSSP